jgi:hypothetical protein
MAFGDEGAAAGFAGANVPIIGGHHLLALPAARQKALDGADREQLFFGLSRDHL